MNISIHISPAIIRRLISQAEEDYPIETCGLLAGLNRTVRLMIPITNLLASQVEFQMDPEEQLGAFRMIEKLGYDLLAIYHSHPKGPSHPSEKDLNSHYYPNVYAIILSKITEDWQIRAYDINDNSWQEVRVLKKK